MFLASVIEGLQTSLWLPTVKVWYSEPNAWFIALVKVNHTVKLTSCDNRRCECGGLKCSGCRWLWGMKSLNRSFTSPTEPVPINWPRGGKKLTSTLRPSSEVSGENLVTHTGRHAKGCCVCGRRGWVGTHSPSCLKKGIHKVWATDIMPCMRAYAHLQTCTYTRSAYTQATRMHTDSPITSLSPPLPLPLTLPHTHKIRPYYPGVLSPTCLLILLFFLKRERFFFLFLFAVLLYHITYTLPAGFLIFFSLFPFLLGCFTQLRTVYFGKGWHCKRDCLVGGRWVRCGVRVRVHSSWLTLASDGGGAYGKGPLTGMAAQYIGSCCPLSSLPTLR